MNDFIRQALAAAHLTLDCEVDDIECVSEEECEACLIRITQTYYVDPMCFTIVIRCVHDGKRYSPSVLDSNHNNGNNDADNVC
jgi:hypothetical protein